MSTIIDHLMSRDGRVAPRAIAAAFGITSTAAASELRQLEEAGRITSGRNGNGFCYWISPAQAIAEHRRHEATAARGAAPVGVAILSDPVRLAGRLIHLERLLAREVFSADATLRAIANDYRATLAAVQSQDELEELHS